VVRVPILLSSPLRPWALGNVPLEICSKIAPGRKKEDIPVLEQRELVKQAVQRRLKTATMHFWTDGSSHVEMRMSGAAAVLYKRKQENEGTHDHHTAGRYLRVPPALDSGPVPTGAPCLGMDTENDMEGTQNSLRDGRRGDTRGRTSVSALAGEGVGEWEKILRKTKGCGPLACSFTTEGEGLEMALESLVTLLEGHEGAEEIVGFVDCGSLLDALKSGTDQDDPVMINIIMLMITLRKRHRVILQHVYSHCGIEESDEVDEMADEAAREDAKVRGKKENGGQVRVTFRDVRALVRQWVKQQTVNRVSKFLVHPKYVKREVEDIWPREDQVIAAQIRTGEVRFLGECIRRIDRRMAESCRFCCPQDHAPERKTKDDSHQNGAPRGSHDPVKCIGCGKMFEGQNSVARHRRHLESSELGKACKAKGAKAYVLRAEKRDEEKPKKKDIPRRESTAGAPKETLVHVLTECEEARRIWGEHDGTLRGMVEFIRKIKRYFDEQRERDLRAIRERRLQKQHVGQHRSTRADAAAPGVPHRSGTDAPGRAHPKRGRHGDPVPGATSGGGLGGGPSTDRDVRPSRTSPARRSRPPSRGANAELQR